MSSKPSLHNLIASTSIALFDTLPKHGKPHIRSNGVPEWTILATICLVIFKAAAVAQAGQQAHGEHEIQVASLGSGVKCLPANKLSPCGDTLHDSHAEILARRGFKKWLMSEAKRSLRLPESSGQSLVQLNRETNRFGLRQDVQVWLYVSNLPCGDASTLHTAAHQPLDMATLKSSKDGHRPIHNDGTAIRGRNGYEAFGAIRTKPGRADSVPATSFSCSDKIASWSVLGLQGALLANIFEPIYLDGIVVGGVEDPPDHWTGKKGDWTGTIKDEVQRAVWGRLEVIKDRLVPPYTLHRPEVHVTSTTFPCTKSEILRKSSLEPATSVTSLLHLPWTGSTPEVIFNGSRAGAWKAPGSKALPERNRSSVCKLELLRAFDDLHQDLHSSLGGSQLGSTDSNVKTYFEIKHGELASAYQRAKTVLRGTPSKADDSIDDAFKKTGQSFQVTAGLDDSGHSPPFRGWIVSGREYESFTVDGELKTMH